MKITIWGARGSIPSSGPDTTYFGGNTSCVEVSYQDQLLILDAGSGLRRLNQSRKPFGKRIDILLTHLHFDHIQGLGFFDPLFDPETEFHIWGPASSSQSLQSRLNRYLSPPLFPVHIRDLTSNLIFHEIDRSVFEIGPLQLESNFIFHPGPTVGFRISSQHAVFTYMPDHEPALGGGSLSTDPQWLSGIDLAWEADLMIHDAQYTSEEYQLRKGWGHSSMEDASNFASLANVKHLLLFHHDPGHSDDHLKANFGEFKMNHHYDCKIDLAVEGMELELP
ncbi:MAG: MBL fold metallo-hydrolase [Cyclobacteriaceae bacterium]